MNDSYLSLICSFMWQITIRGSEIVNHAIQKLIVYPLYIILASSSFLAF
jgi:hypothetical protein